MKSNGMSKDEMFDFSIDQLMLVDKAEVLHDKWRILSVECDGLYSRDGKVPSELEKDRDNAYNEWQDAEKAIELAIKSEPIGILPEDIPY